MMHLSYSTYCVRLPWDPTFRIKTTRPSAERESLSGAMIRQSGTKAISTGTWSYTGLITTADAATLKTLDENYASVYFSDGTNLYVSEIDCTIIPSVRAGRQKVSIEGKIVRKVL